MIITISKDELAKALGVVIKGVNSHFTLPIYACVYMDANREDGTLTLQTADMETFIKNTVPALIDEPGQAVIPAKLLNDIVKSLPAEAITIQTSPDANMATLTCASSTFTLNTFSPEDFPTFPEVDPISTVTLPAKDVDSMVKSVIYALSADQARIILTGILVEFISNTITMVSTDSYRVAKIQRAIDGPEIEDFSVVVPGTTFKDVVSSASGEKEITFAYTDNQMIFTFGTTTFVTRRLEGNFPNYRKVFPTDHSTSFTCATDDLINAIKRIRILVNASPMKNSSIRFSISPDEGVVTISANFVDLGGGIEKVSAAIEGEALEISFNPGYILDGLSAVATDEVRAEFTAAARPGVFSNTEEEIAPFSYLVMPVRSN